MELARDPLVAIRNHRGVWYASGIRWMVSERHFRTLPYLLVYVLLEILKAMAGGLSRGIVDMG